MRRIPLIELESTQVLRTMGQYVGLTRVPVPGATHAPTGGTNISKSTDGSLPDTSGPSNHSKKSTISARERVALTRTTSKAYETTTTLTSTPLLAWDNGYRRIVSYHLFLQEISL